MSSASIVLGDGTVIPLTLVEAVRDKFGDWNAGSLYSEDEDESGFIEMIAETLSIVLAKRATDTADPEPDPQTELASTSPE